MRSAFPTPSDEVFGRLTPSHLSFPVVGIGGSAGGLQALQTFFANTPADPGMAFVVILHLSPDHESSAAEILQRSCAMPVSQVTTSVPVEINHVYVIAPRADLMMNDGHLEMAPKARAIGPAVAIDVFFRTLAQVHRNHAFAIVLSGTGSDGAVGLARIKAEGGVTLAQVPEEAEHGDMPRAAIATGLVDIVLPAAEMGRRLIDLWASARRIELPTGDSDPSNTPVHKAPDHDSTYRKETALQDIMNLLRSYTHHDFRHYKRGTVLRRIERRLQVNGLTTLESYRDYLRKEPKEAVPLLQDMLISVTNFFRDSQAFEALGQKVLPHLVANVEEGEQARIWVAGCATGEESYSLAMLMREAAEATGRPSDLQIFATDIDERALATARRGVYPGGIAADVSPERLHQFFVKEEDQYRIQTGLREQVLFAAHNLLRDPPFSRLDLICCRNLLIYLDPGAQASVLEMFHYALRPGGHLFLGSSESADSAGSRFIAVDPKNRIFRAQGGSTVRIQPAAQNGFQRDPAPSLMQSGATAPPQSNPARSAVSAMHSQAIEAVSPASVLIDAQHDILHLSATAGRYMEHGGGAPSANLLNNVEPDLRLELRTALFQATQSGAKVQTKVLQARPGVPSNWLKIDIHPFPAGDNAPQRTLVIFEEADLEDSPAETGGERSTTEREAAHNLIMGKAEAEIRQLKINLQDTLERSALSTEELRAANEELQAINEELRSATEELETSKEELQSMNEELTTVNFELRAKVEERGQINDDLQNLIASSEVATIFVDSALRVKRFTPQASTLFNLIASDAGRSLLDITHRLHYDSLLADAESVFKSLKPVEHRITTNDGRHLLARILPYRTTGDKIEGAVLTFIDISELHRAEENVRSSEERLRIAAASTSDFAIITTDDAGLITAWNQGAQRVFGYDAEESLGQPLEIIFTPEDQASGVPEKEMHLAREMGRADDERWHMRKDGTTFYCSGVLTYLQGRAGGYSKIARDTTGSKRQELAKENLLLKEQQESTNARLANELKDRFLAVMSHELKQPLNLIQVNAELLTRLPETKAIPSAKRIGTTIQQAVLSQSRIINDLLDLSRIRTGKLRLNVEKVDLDEVMHALARAALGDIERKHIKLVVSSHERIECLCDRVRVEQIIWNLLNNAIKFTPAGGEITLALESANGSAQITVSDSGIGIAAAALPVIFELFSQVDPQVVKGNSGLGIGLSLVKELVVAHGGRVQVSSGGLGEGSTFRVWLPIDGDGAIVEHLAEMSEVSFDGKRILTVDDDADGLNGFAALLRLEGATVDAVDSAAHALKLLASQTYDLLISDISMPDMDGCELIAEVRRRLPNQRLLAVSMSGYGRVVDAVRSKSAGFDLHVSKPTSIAQLKNALAKYGSERGA